MASPLSDLIWSVAELLRGDYKQSDYGKVILPFTLLRRLDCVLEPTRDAVLEAFRATEGQPELSRERALVKAAGQSFYNTGRLSLRSMLGDPANLRQNLSYYVVSFSENAREIFLRYKFSDQIEYLDSKNLLFLVLQQFASLDLSPASVDNAGMGMVFEELIRKFSELSNETAGEHFTPREVIRLMVNILFGEDSAALSSPGVIRTLYDPACGTGGMLSVSEGHLHAMNPGAILKVYGQELNDESYAVCKADMLIKGQDVRNIICGNTLSNDGLPGHTFDYGLSNPPFGVEWKKVEKAVRDEHEKKGFAGRFGPGLPRVSDGSLLFLLHLISKMRPVHEGGSRIAIVLNGSPLFTGGAGSGESEIRRYVLENDLLETIVALPTDMFYNTGIATYIWILTNRKAENRKGRVQLINAVELWKKMKKSLGSKRKELGEDDIDRISKTFNAFRENDICKIVPNEEFGYRTITVERPLRVVYDCSPEKMDRIFYSEVFNRLTRITKLIERKSETIGGLDFNAFAALAGESWVSHGASDEEREKNGVFVHFLLKEILAGKFFMSRRAFESFIEDELSPKNLHFSHLGFAILAEALEVHDQRGEPVQSTRKKSASGYEPDASLRDTENVPLSEDIEAYFAREVLPHVPDAWIDHSKTKVGYEIPFTRYFYTYTPPRPLEEIDADLKAKTETIMALLREITK